MLRSSVSLIVFTILSAGLMGCATPFEAAETSDSGFGYTVKPIQGEKLEGVFVAQFSGNGYTDSLDARNYSEMAAFQFCSKQGRFTRVLTEPKDYSTSTTYTQVSSSTSVINGVPYTNTYSYPVTLHFPRYGVVFHCLKQWIPLVGYGDLEAISKELLHPIKKDFRGGVLIRSVPEDELTTPFKRGDVIVSVGKDRIEDTIDLYWLATKSEAGNVDVEIIRDGKLKKVKGRFVDLTDPYRKASSASVIKVCRQFSGADDSSPCPHNGKTL